MNNLHRIICCTIVLFAVPVAVLAEERFVDANADRVERFLRDNFAEGNAGMVIGLLDKHGSKVFGAGKLDNGSDQTVNADTVFEIGSTSKTFTSLLLLGLAGRGELKLDDPVSKYLPEGVKVPSYEGNEISLLHLAAQESGLPFNAGNLSSKPFPANYNGIHQHMLVADRNAVEFYRRCGFQRAVATEPMWIYDGDDH